ncbi:MAG: IS6 family transposase [Thaumarchaeota archaeon]|nr:IS6 family transposase [Nitrososphaerota archaeon]
MDMHVVVKDTHFTVITQAFSLTLRDTPANRKAAVVLLRVMSDESGMPLFTLQQLSCIVGSANRQAASQHMEDFRACGQDMKAVVLRDRKVDETVVEAVTGELLQAPLTTTEALCERVRHRLGRTDISWANIEAALEQISCRELRRVMRVQLAQGGAHYKESYLLDTLLYSCENSVDLFPGLEGPEPMEAAPVTDPSAIRTLLTPGASMEAVPRALQWIGVLLTLYYWGVPLSRLGLWVGVQKTTVWRWLMGFVRAVFPLVQDLLKDKVRAAVVLIDEKWIKLRGVWYYWFVAIDAATGLPLASYLSPSRSAWACRYMGAKLRALGLSIKAIVTDGLESYRALLPEVVHQVCLFHHQQDVFRWCRQHLGESEQARFCQHQMLTLVQTIEKRTLRRRLERLVRMADQLGISPWIEKLMEKLDRLLPAIGSRTIPRTTNSIERFFRTFNRFYKTRCGFHSLSSARWELALFLLVYLFTKQEKEGLAPIEAILPQASAMPLYRLINDPLATLLGLDHVKLPQKMADDELAVALAA